MKGKFFYFTSDSVGMTSKNIWNARISATICCGAEKRESSKKGNTLYTLLNAVIHEVQSVFSSLLLIIALLMIIILMMIMSTI